MRAGDPVRPGPASRAGPGEPVHLHATAGSELLKVRFPAPTSHITLTPDEQ